MVMEESHERNKKGSSSSSNDRKRSLAIENFPRMSNDAIEKCWIQKVELVRKLRKKMYDDMMESHSNRPIKHNCIKSLEEENSDSMHEKMNVEQKQHDIPSSSVVVDASNHLKQINIIDPTISKIANKLKKSL